MPAATEVHDHLADYTLLATSFRRSLLAENKSPTTIANYCEAVRQLGVYLAAQGMPTTPGNVRREHVEAFLAHLVEQGAKPNTVATRHKALKVFFGWLLEE